MLIDARGKACPLPILELARTLRTLQPGDEVTLVADDPAAEPDVRAFCEATGHLLVSLTVDGRLIRALVRKAEPTST